MTAGPYRTETQVPRASASRRTISLLPASSAGVSSGTGGCRCPRRVSGG